MPWVFNTKYVLVPILILGSLFILHSRESARGATGEDFESMILETDHLADLFPHEHDAGEAVEDKGHHHYHYSPIVVADRDLWIASTTFKIMNAPDTTVHHASLVAVNREHQNCKQWPFEELVQFGQDNMHAPSVVFPSGTGMQIEKGEAYRLVLMVHNPLPAPLAEADYGFTLNQKSENSLPSSSHGWTRTSSAVSPTGRPWYCPPVWRHSASVTAIRHS